MPKQTWVGSLQPFHNADGTSQTAAALAEISPRPPKQILGYQDAIQTYWRITAFGKITTAATPGTWTFGIYMGTSDTIASGQAVVTSAAGTAVASMTNVTWWIDGVMQCRAEGTGTNASALASFRLYNVFSASGVAIAPASAPAAFAFDSTVANYIKLGITPSVATGSITCHYFNVEQLN